MRYSLTSGNDLGHFSVEESTGVVRVAAEAEGEGGGPGLDREQQRRYSLAVRAEDQGGKVRGLNLQYIQYIGTKIFKILFFVPILGVHGDCERDRDRRQRQPASVRRGPIFLPVAKE